MQELIAVQSQMILGKGVGVCFYRPSRGRRQNIMCWRWGPEGNPTSVTGAGDGEQLRKVVQGGGWVLRWEKWV